VEGEKPRQDVERRGLSSSEERGARGEGPGPRPLCKNPGKGISQGSTVGKQRGTRITGGESELCFSLKQEGLERGTGKKGAASKLSQHGKTSAPTGCMEMAIRIQ